MKKIVIPHQIADNAIKIAPSKDRNDLWIEWELIKPWGITIDESNKLFKELIVKATGREEAVNFQLTRKEIKKIKVALQRYGR